MEEGGWGRGGGWNLLGGEAEDEGDGPDEGGESLEQARPVLLHQAPRALPHHLALPRALSPRHAPQCTARCGRRRGLGTSLSKTAREIRKVPTSSFTGDSEMCSVTPTSTEDPDACASQHIKGFGASGALAAHAPIPAQMTNRSRADHSLSSTGVGKRNPPTRWQVPPSCDLTTK